MADEGAPQADASENSSDEAVHRRRARGRRKAIYLHLASEAALVVGILADGTVRYLFLGIAAVIFAAAMRASLEGPDAD